MASIQTLVGLHIRYENHIVFILQFNQITQLVVHYILRSHIVLYGVITIKCWQNSQIL